MSEAARVISRFDRDITVPPWLLRLPVSNVARLTAVFLLGYEQCGESPVLEQLSDDLGVDRRIVIRYLDELRAIKALRTRKVGRYNLYLLYNPNERHYKARKTTNGDRTITDHERHQEALEGGTGDRTITGRRHVVVDSISLQDSPNQIEPTTTSLTKTALWLKDQGVSSYQEFAHLDYDAVRDDFTRRRAAGQYIGVIVAAWRVAPPAPAGGAGTSHLPEWMRRLAQQEPGLYKLGGDAYQGEGRNDDAEWDNYLNNLEEP